MSCENVPRAKRCWAATYSSPTSRGAVQTATKLLQLAARNGLGELATLDAAGRRGGRSDVAVCRRRHLANLHHVDHAPF